MRFDLALFVCCCKSFLSGDESPESDYYSLLGLERDASAEDIKKGYKKKSLQMHRKYYARMWTSHLITSSYLSHIYLMLTKKPFQHTSSPS
jgi:preprotein translocase subunit Sec63